MNLDLRPEGSKAAGRWAAWFLVCIALSAAACGSPHSSSQASPTVTNSPTPDAVTQAYIDLVRKYHDRYVTARGDGYQYCVVELDAPNCQARGVAMITVWDSFLNDLDSTPVPPKFAADVKIIHNQLPKGIADLKAMVEAAAAGDKTAMLRAADTYISDMVPAVTHALGDAYEPWSAE